MHWYKSSGIIRYDPPRGTMKNRVNWWCVIECDPDIARYYRYWVDKEILNPIGMPGAGLCLPSWGSHISIVRGEQPRLEHEHQWRQYEGAKVEFEYQHEVIQTGQDPTKPRPDCFWFVHVRCPLAREIRGSFGLYTSYTLHITIGRVYK